MSNVGYLAGENPEKRLKMLQTYLHDTLAPKIRQWQIIDAAARRLMAAQERIKQGSWLPSEADCAELDAAWADLRVALGLTPDSEAA